jgi:uncharacterized membrane protein YjjP (DUF1212 family)
VLYGPTLRMSRLTFTIVWLSLSAAGISAVYGGPIWAYPPAIFLGLICTVFVTVLTTNISSRCMFAALGCFMIFVAMVQFASESVTPWTVNQSAFGLFLGLAWVWSAAFPHR